MLKGRGGTACTYIRKTMLLCSVLLRIRLRYLDCVHLLDPRPYLTLYYAGFTFFLAYLFIKYPLVFLYLQICIPVFLRLRPFFSVLSALLLPSLATTAPEPLSTISLLFPSIPTLQL